MKQLRKKIENLCMAVSFAEAGCFDTALLMLNDNKPGKRVHLADFLKDVGLTNAPVTFGLAHI